jgi:lysophospholipase L1-like esterase
MGLRERELPPKVPSERRLLILGDSFTFGHGVEGLEAYPQRIEEVLRAEGQPELTVVNAGVPGYGTRQETLWFERILNQVLPDAVLLGFFVNDFTDNLDEKLKVIDGYLVTVSRRGSRLNLIQALGLPPEVRVALGTRLHLYRFFQNAWVKFVTTHGWSNTREAFDIYREHPPEHTVHAITATEKALKRLAEICRSHNLPLGLVVIPDGRTQVLLTLAHESDYELGRPSQIVQKVAQAEDILFFDLSEVFQKQIDLYFPVNGHWNALGHRVAGRAIAASLLHGELMPLVDRP